MTTQRCPKREAHAAHQWPSGMRGSRCPGIAAPVTRRAFSTGTNTFRVMRALGSVSSSHSFAATLTKYGPVVLLALAAHHDQDYSAARPTGARPGYTPAELAPFCGLGVSTVSAALLSMYRLGYVERYPTHPGFRYTIAIGLGS